MYDNKVPWSYKKGLIAPGKKAQRRLRGGGNIGS